MADQLLQILNQTTETSGDYPFTPLEVVCLRNTQNSVETMQVLLDSGADPNANGSYPLMIAAQAFKNASTPESREYGSAMILILLNHDANPFRCIPGRFRITAFQFMLGLDLPVSIITTALNKLKDGIFVPETDNTTEW